MGLQKKNDFFFFGGGEILIFLPQLNGEEFDSRCFFKVPLGDGPPNDESNCELFGYFPPMGSSRL